MAQYKVPQDTQRVDQIFGPFTLRQFLFILGGGMFGYIVFITTSKIMPASTSLMLSSLMFIIIASFAIIKVQGMSLPEYVTALIVYLAKPRKRIWQKDIFTPDIAFLKSDDVDKEEASTANPDEVKSRLDQLAHVLDTRGWSGPTEEEVVKQDVPQVETPQIMDSNITKEIRTPETETSPIINQDKTKEIAVQKLPKAETQPNLEQKINIEAIKQAASQVKTPQVVKQETTVKAKVSSVLPEPPVAEASPVSPASTRIVPPADKKQEEIEKLLQIQERREKVIHQEMNKMEERLRKELQNKFSQETKEEINRQKQSLKKLKNTVSTLENETLKKTEIKKIKKAKIRTAPEPKPKTMANDYSSIMKGRIATAASDTKHMNISVDESKLDDVLSEIENPTTDADFAKLSEAILAKKHIIKTAKIIKEST